MDLEIYLSPRIRATLAPEQLATLVAAFRKLKETKKSPAIFGRDTNFNRPSSAVFSELRHTHVHPNFLTKQPINKVANLLRTWNLQAAPFDQRSDTWLIYCQGWRNPGNYLFIAFWKIDAHELARSTTLMAALAEEAEKFRKNY